MIRRTRPQSGTLTRAQSDKSSSSKSIGRDHQAGPSAAAQTEINGTLFHDSSTHDFDLARWLVGDEVSEVDAYAASLAIPEMKRFGGFDSGVVNLQFTRGAIGNVEPYID